MLPFALWERAVGRGDRQQVGGVLLGMALGDGNWLPGALKSHSVCPSENKAWLGSRVPCPVNRVGMTVSKTHLFSHSLYPSFLFSFPEHLCIFFCLFFPLSDLSMFFSSPSQEVNVFFLYSMYLSESLCLPCNPSLSSLVAMVSIHLYFPFPCRVTTRFRGRE